MACPHLGGLTKYTLYCCVLAYRYGQAITPRAILKQIITIPLDVTACPHPGEMWRLAHIQGRTSRKKEKNPMRTKTTTKERENLLFFSINTWLKPHLPSLAQSFHRDCHFRSPSLVIFSKIPWRPSPLWSFAAGAASRRTLLLAVWSARPMRLCCTKI